ncbi:hypothetical protein GCM10009565_53130 [Amycolatopsis albidoflavus]
MPRRNASTTDSSNSPLPSSPTAKYPRTRNPRPPAAGTAPPSSNTSASASPANSAPNPANAAARPADTPLSTLSNPDTTRPAEPGTGAAACPPAEPRPAAGDAGAVRRRRLGASPSLCCWRLPRPAPSSPAPGRSSSGASRYRAPSSFSTPPSTNAVKARPSVAAMIPGNASLTSSRVNSRRGLSENSASIRSRADAPSAWTSPSTGGGTAS